MRVVRVSGNPLKALPSELSHYRANAEELRVFGHLWYSDRCLGDFADAVIHKQPRSLLAITGDHWSRRCLEPRPSIFERKAVPMVFYAPEILSVLTHPPRIAGSHNDILPTLIGLAAPTGFVYHAFGRNLFDISQPQVGFGSQMVVTPDAIFEVEPSAGPESLEGQRLQSSAQFSELGLRYRQVHAVAWWRITKGNLLP